MKKLLEELKWQIAWSYREWLFSWIHSLLIVIPTMLIILIHPILKYPFLRKHPSYWLPFLLNTWIVWPIVILLLFTIFLIFWIFLFTLIHFTLMRKEKNQIGVILKVYERDRREEGKLIRSMVNMISIWPTLKEIQRFLKKK